MKAYAVILILLTAVIGTVAAGYFVVRDHLAAQKLPIMAQSFDFSLSDQEGADFAGSRLAGKLWIANFFFSSCEGVCPTINGAIARFADRIKNSSDVQFVSISVDTARDTVPVIKAYAAKFKADTTRWHFLTGKQETVNAILNAWKLGFADDPMQHTSRLVLLDRSGRVRGYYQGTDDDAFEMLERDLALLSRES